MKKPRLCVAKVRRLSLCSCGSGLFSSESKVKIGTKYLIDLSTLESGKLFCGNCSKSTDCFVVQTLEREGVTNKGGLPVEVFEPIWKSVLLKEALKLRKEFDRAQKKQ